jgi:hypothetical protein
MKVLPVGRRVVTHVVTDALLGCLSVDLSHRWRAANTQRLIFRTILANDDRPRTVHAESEHTELNLLPEMVANAIERNEARRRVCHPVWQAYMERAQALGPRPHDRRGHDPHRRCRPGR